MKTPIAFLSALFAVFWTCPAAAGDQSAAEPESAIATRVSLTVSGRDISLATWEADYFARALKHHLDSCEKTSALRSPPEVPRDSRYVMVVDYRDGSSLTLVQSRNAHQSYDFRLVSESRDAVLLYWECAASTGLPIGGLLQGKQLAMEDAESERQQLIAYQEPAVRGSRLTAYEPNMVGWSFDENDVNEGYLDALISLKYPFLHDGFYAPDAAILNPFFAFTGRFSQYIESRDSSPVIGKRFNPKFFLRHWLDSGSYVDLGYAHESNGQSITTEEAYLRERDDFVAEGQDPEFARDYISRGWDYLSLDWRKDWRPKARFLGEGQLTSYLNFKYFLDDGLLQGEPEESNEWEGDGVNRRKEYDGVSFTVKYEFGKALCLGGDTGADALYGTSSSICLSKIAWRQTSGYDGLFENNTSRLELTASLLDIPFTLWGQRGYNSDLVDYYRRVDSWGLALELRSF